MSRCDRQQPCTANKSNNADARSWPTSPRSASAYPAASSNAPPDAATPAATATATLTASTGPYLSWTRTVDAKTVTRNLTAAQADRYRTWFDNTKRLRELVSELEALSVQTAIEAEGWEPTN